MKKTSSGDYKCSICGKIFNNSGPCRDHERMCGITKLDRFTDEEKEGTTNLDV